jgi:hypothetical protein
MVDAVQTMTIALISYRGYLVRVRKSGAWYEWTVDGISPAEKKKQIKFLKDADKRVVKYRRLHRQLKKRHTGEDKEFYDWLCQKRRLNHRATRIYDPTSMPTARGHKCSAQWYGQDQVRALIGNCNV